ncbi:hypothetical protein CCU51_02300 [Listeria monocytogenes]|uniref:hypothetical protein n=1 Tax=Listeria monocytogenes TaxID=1639 RepID=UPI0008753BCE|nr:hypothetical protein [Listeria monocytogenes]EAA0416209.1 hypothetical protein [Listeria monocytogenes]EAC4837800.1 hypothetical protein [Listeria monocytogenes]EAC7306558.1 hypothetical protein [Listeria monocytogenes]EAD2640993.1 hypothetical protein [Listeria monocytogenes]EAD8851286.1 hypothetical protein [Listeria monocytogenes]
MEIKVQKKLTDGRIAFSSEYGECVGIWADEDPEPSRVYTVEITIPDKISAELLHESEEKHCALEIDEEGLVHVIGKLEDYEEDGFAVLRLEESIICFDTKFSEEIEMLHGRFVEFVIPEIKLSNVGI